MVGVNFLLLVRDLLLSIGKRDRLLSNRLKIIRELSFHNELIQIEWISFFFIVRMMMKFEFPRTADSILTAGHSK